MNVDIVEAIYEWGWKSLGDSPTVTGGGPFQHPDMERILEYLHENDADPSVYSNLIPITEEQYPVIQKNAEKMFTTIDHVHESGHYEQRGGFKATIQTLKDLIDHDVTVGVNCVVTKNNYQDVHEIHAELSKLELDSLFFMPASVPPDVELSIEDIPDQEKEELVENLQP